MRTVAVVLLMADVKFALLLVGPKVNVPVVALKQPPKQSSTSAAHGSGVLTVSVVKMPDDCVPPVVLIAATIAHPHVDCTGLKMMLTRDDARMPLVTR